MKQKQVAQAKAAEQLQKIFRQRGSKALETARKEVLQEKIECKEAREALSYFMTKYWHDLARPSLMSLVCEAVDGDPALTTPIAVPMTLISGAIDIHDDIIDQSRQKYGRPTVYGKYGKDIALLVGDALLFKGLTLLNTATENDVLAPKMGRIVREIKDMFFELGDAEALELQFRRSLDVSPEEYLRVVRKKAADVEAHTRISAFVGGASSRQVDALGEYGRLLGMLLILRDDWLDIVDLQESVHRFKYESLPLPVLYALQNPSTSRLLRRVLTKKVVRQKDAETVLSIVNKTNVLETYQGLMKRFFNEACSKLSEVRKNSRELKILLDSTLLLSDEKKT